MRNSISWFEIPVKNFARAKAFYEVVLDCEIELIPSAQSKYGFIPFDAQNGGASGAIVERPDYVAPEMGCLIYLNGGEDLSIPLSRVEIAGGTIISGKEFKGDNGYIAYFKDTEGTLLGFHSMH